MLIGIDALLSIYERFFVNLQVLIGIQASLLMYQLFFGSPSVLNRRCYIIVFSSLLDSADPYVYIFTLLGSLGSCVLTLLNFLFLGVISFCLLFSPVSIFIGLHSLAFWLVVERPSFEPHCRVDRYPNQLDRGHSKKEN